MGDVHAPTNVEMQLQSTEAYQECERLLRETRFFQMHNPAASRPGSHFTAIKVSVGRRQRAVAVDHPDPPPAGFAKVADFVNNLAKRAKPPDPALPGKTLDTIKAPHPN